MCENLRQEAPTFGRGVSLLELSAEMLREKHSLELVRCSFFGDLGVVGLRFGARLGAELSGDWV